MEGQIVEREAEALDKGFDIDGFIQMRNEFIEKVNRIMVEGKDYHIIQGRKSMAKGGAEKIASIFGWSASFEKDQEAMDAFANLKDIICFVCNLMSKDGRQVGQGRGAASLSKNGNDPNKTLKMAQKSAFIDAAIRASGLSDFFTQDLEDMDASQIEDFQGAPSSVAPASEKQKSLIKTLMKEKGVERLSDIGFADQELTKEYAKQIIDGLLKLNANAA